MMFAGIRGWRLSTGVGVGLAAAVGSWAPIINSIGPSGVSDIVITIIVLGFSIAGFVFGVIPFGRLVGIFCLGFTGGLAFGVRIMILRPGLLFNGSGLYVTNWVLIVLFGAMGAMSMIWGRSQRAGLLFSCASVGTFLTFLGADLIIHKQAGFSRGLRFLFDRNASHFLDIVGGGYDPPGATLLLIGISLGATPIFAVGQHFVFKHPFDRTKEKNDIVGGSEEAEISEKGNSAPPGSARQRPQAGLGTGPRSTPAWGRGVPMSGVFGSAQRTASGLWDSWRRKQ
ncbi:unnamed protein product [Cyclocybe aegerita]|uniref:TM7S3/TM198-like domain-containing protein n=1 Tax=Cyclocybe aegerita TaxID=1973307 RepID=A0A8S0WWH3_CYCAE|nr:unnamed protein product [Cyclocybe aegerita]